jgi:DHA1 family bicyclomycin/chloramphenicol resistance-like MFS transporter
MLILILGVSPILAPTVGSYIVSNLGWQMVFVVLAIITTLILLAVIKWLPESRMADLSISLKPGPILNGFRTILKEPQFTTYAFASSIASAGLFAYIAGSPFVFMELYGVSEQNYGLIFAFVAAGLIGSSQLNNLILRKYNSAQILRTVIIAQAIIGLTLLTGIATGVIGLYTTIGLIFLFLSCQGFTFPNGAALAMAPFSRGAGSASALLGAFQMVCGAIASALVGVFFNSTAVPMAAIMAFCCVLGLVILLRGRKLIEYKVKQEMIDQQTLELIEKC